VSVQDDDVQGYALGVVFGIIGLVVAGVIALASVTALHKPAAATAVAAASATLVQRVYFDLGQDTLPGEAAEALARVADAARENRQATVLISGFHDASGDRAANADLARRRALRVRHALEANGVAPSQLVLSKPALATGQGDAREARRVEVTLQ